MGFLGNLFSKGKAAENPLLWDMHNHILFGIDDGSRTIEDSVMMARQFVDAGYREIVATPHIMGEYYPNNKEIIQDRKEKLEKALLEQSIPLKLHFAAEHYIDEGLLEKIRNQEELLSFHNKHILVETSFLNKPVFFNQIIFDLKTLGYTPVFAHPERYIYLHDNYAAAEQILDLGVKFQVNLMSLIGYYSPMVKKFAQWLIRHGHYSFLGTDAHSEDHLKKLPEIFKSKLFQSIDFTKVENCGPMK